MDNIPLYETMNKQLFNSKCQGSNEIWVEAAGAWDADNISYMAGHLAKNDKWGWIINIMNL